MKRRGTPCRCIRCREVGLNSRSQDYADAQLFVREYNAGGEGGRELFISFESPDEKFLFGFVRLRLSPNSGKDAEGNTVFASLVGSALVRELHVYGQLVATYDKRGHASSQHAGFGGRLMQEAESVAWRRGYRRVAVIAGIGTRNYYRKLGYHLDETFLVKRMYVPPAARALARRAWRATRGLPRSAWTWVGEARPDQRVLALVVVLLGVGMVCVQFFFEWLVLALQFEDFEVWGGKR